MNFIEFYDYHVPALEADEVRHHVLLHGFVSVTHRPTRDFRGWTFGPPGACAIQPNADWFILLGDIDGDQARGLADDLADKDFPGVLGAGDAVAQFAARVKELGIPLKEPEHRHILGLEGLPRFPDIPGSARIVTADDTELFGEWRSAYMRLECPDYPEPGAADLERLASQGNFLFWTVDGAPVAMAEIAGETNSGASVGGTYAPESSRGRGYGAAIVAAAAQHILDQGHSKVFATIRLDNAPALRNAMKVGLQPVASYAQYWRSMA